MNKFEKSQKQQSVNINPDDIIKRLVEWIAEKGYMRGNKTGELLRDALAYINKMKKYQRDILNGTNKMQIYHIQTLVYPPIAPGTKVITFIDAGMESEDWSDEAKRTRQHEKNGTVIGHHDSHGLCFDVQHSDGTKSCYELHELIVDNK